MPRTPRKPEEIEEEKQRILDEALNIIAESGYSGLTMRGLGQRLGMAAKTIYNYFQNKDEVRSMKDGRIIPRISTWTGRTVMSWSGMDCT